MLCHWMKEKNLQVDPSRVLRDKVRERWLQYSVYADSQLILKIEMMC